MSEKFYDDLTKLDKDQKIFELAALFFEIKDIAYFIGMNPEELANLVKLHPEHEYSIAYHRGQLKTKILLRFDARRYAVSGSPDANKEMLAHLIEQQTGEDDA